MAALNAKKIQTAKSADTLPVSTMNLPPGATLIDPQSPGTVQVRPNLPEGYTLREPQSSGNQNRPVPPEGYTLDGPQSSRNVAAATIKAQEDAHLATILAKHPDALNLEPEIEKWIATQPVSIRDEYTRVLNHGNSQEVIWLIDVYKKHK